MHYPGRALIDTEAIKSNIQVLRQHAPQSQPLAVVKADAYGHGLELVAATARQAGVEFFGIAQASEALRLRRYFDASSSGALRRPRILTWIFLTDQDLPALIAADLELSVSTPEQLQQIAAVAGRLEHAALVHLKVDTGMGRAGAVPARFGALLRAAETACAESGGYLKVVGIWSHLACADDPSETGEGFTLRQIEVFETACQQLKEAGFKNVIRHLSASSGILWHPRAHYDLVRMGIAMYGLSPNPQRASSYELGLRPAMRLCARLTSVKQVRQGTTVSYGATWQAPRDTWLGIVPLGYADGLPRQASGKVIVSDHEGRVYPQVGRICMDQFMIDLGPQPPSLKIGDEVTLFGSSQVSADDWAQAAQTINYTIVTQIGPRVRRETVAEEWPEADADDTRGKATSER